MRPGIAAPACQPVCFHCRNGSSRPCSHQLWLLAVFGLLNVAAARPVCCAAGKSAWSRTSGGPTTWRTRQAALPLVALLPLPLPLLLLLLLILLLQALCLHPIMSTPVPLSRLLEPHCLPPPSPLLTWRRHGTTFRRTPAARSTCCSGSMAMWRMPPQVSTAACLFHPAAIGHAYLMPSCMRLISLSLCLLRLLCLQRTFWSGSGWRRGPRGATIQ